jgi:hypothetical protein
MRKILRIVVIGLLLCSCAKPVGIYNKNDSNFFTSSFETATGGSIENHILFGESSKEIVNRAKMRCKKINPESKVKNLRLVFHGNLLTDPKNLLVYDCK